MSHDYTSNFLNVPKALQGSISAFYSRSSRLIVLDGPRGRLLAHYPHSIVPNPARHQFLVTYPEDYVPFDGGGVPHKAVADVCAIAIPIEHGIDGRDTIVAGGAPGLNADIASTPSDLLFFPPEDPGQDRTLSKLNGMKLGPSSFEARFGEGGLAISDDGIRAIGQLHIREPVSKGVTAESPLFGVIPKTAVTFWAADYLPDLKKLQQIASYVLLLGSAIEAVGSIARLLRDMD